MMLPSVGLPLNASKLESMLICGVFVRAERTGTNVKASAHVARSRQPVEGVRVECCPHLGTGKSSADD